MPRGTDGSYSLPNGTLVSAGDTILPSQHNPFANDVASALSGSLSRDGLGGMRANLPMGNYRITNLGLAINGGDAVSVNYLAQYVADRYLPLAGGTLTGPLNISYSGNAAILVNSIGVVIARLVAQSDGSVVLYQNRGAGDVAIFSVNSSSGPINFNIPITRAGNTVWDAANLVSPLKLADLSAGSNANGYWSKRPDGIGGTLIEQWGMVSLPASGGALSSQTITFPTAFADAASIVITAMSADAVANRDVIGIRTETDPTTTSVTIRGDAYTPGFFSAPTRVRWRAVGY